MCSCMLLGGINVKSKEKFIPDTTNVDDAESDDNSVQSVDPFIIARDIAGLKNCVHPDTNKNQYCTTIECFHQLLQDDGIEVNPTRYELQRCTEFYEEYFGIIWSDVITRSGKYNDAIIEQEEDKYIGHDGIVNDCCENSISYMNISLAVCFKSFPKKDRNKFPNLYPVALMEGNDGCLYAWPSFWTHPITPIRSAGVI